MPTGQNKLTHTLVALALLIPAPLACAQLSITLADTTPLPSSATDQHNVAFDVTGVSAVTHLSADRYAAVLDRSDKLILFDLHLNADGAIAALTNIAGLTLDTTADWEGAAALSDTRILLAEEGTPSVVEFDLTTGARVRTIDAPPVFLNRRNNLGLESLTVRAGVGWTANEEALRVDGLRATPSDATDVRLAVFNAGTGEFGAQLVYQVDAMHGGYVPLTNSGQSGLSDLVLLPGGGLLALERSLAFPAPLFDARIYSIDRTGATDVRGLDALDGATFTRVAKTLCWSGDLGNLEGLALGAKLSATESALVAVVDDGDPFSSNQLAVFRLGGLCPPDATGDTTIDTNDFFAYLAAYQANSADADFNADTLVNTNDFFAFLAAYQAGC